MSTIQFDARRMLADLDDLRRIGAVGSGVRRPAYSDDDIAARKWLAGRMADAGLRPVVDEWGNVFGLPLGDEPCLLIGSHTDTQPLGGWLDGSYGVICALEIARAARECGGPRLAVVSFQDEEGRFCGLTGSALWSGVMDRDVADRVRDADGLCLLEARQRAKEIAEVANVSPARFSGYVEAHIEQGPILETAGESLGVVEAIVGVRTLTLALTGLANHAGTTPMKMRRDASRGMVALAFELERALASAAGPSTVWTFGRIVVEPNAPSIIPGFAALTVQFRDPSLAKLEELSSLVERHAHEIAKASHLDLEITSGFSADPVRMNEGFVAALAMACEDVVPGKWRLMQSGALHDASCVGRIMPAAMLFVPSIGGISHNPAEDTDRADLALGLAALARAVERLS
ncbi:hydantoinase/carbamoylase family amidase [Arvimicrobium flavum]|uniref:hydantoinase/carbamoylase family amidase n=1 Tax=Arvimicrobium flavum TaxID=3393320 RepID=UPI00237B9122|nr:hydantoinase/carbamoylase family amidase [Mesorhizobium shangrilense]